MLCGIFNKLCCTPGSQIVVPFFFTALCKGAGRGNIAAGVGWLVEVGRVVGRGLGRRGIVALGWGRRGPSGAGWVGGDHQELGGL